MSISNAVTTCHVILPHNLFFNSVGESQHGILSQMNAILLYNDCPYQALTYPHKHILVCTNMHASIMLVNLVLVSNCKIIPHINVIKKQQHKVQMTPHTILHITVTNSQRKCHKYMWIWQHNQHNFLYAAFSNHRNTRVQSWGCHRNH